MKATVVLRRPAMALGGVILGLSIVQASAAGISLTSQRLTPYQTCTISATPTTTTSVVDASLLQASPTSNFGTATTLTTSSATAANQRIHIRFDLAACNPAIPTTAIVRLATLRVYLTGVPSVCRTLDLFRVTASWTESGITWNNQPFGTTLNNPATGSRSASLTVGTPVGCGNMVAGYVTGATVTSDVAAWVAGSASNFGWMIRDDTEGSATTRTATFSAKDLGTIAQVPQLLVTYVAVP
jgi:hypothetical protein